MSSSEPPQHLHILFSWEAAWSGLNLLYEIEPADEVPETYLGQHLIVIALDNFRGSFSLDGHWQQVDYGQGDIAVFPASEPFPRTQIDRQVPLLELFIEPEILTNAASEANREGIELVRHLHISDPLIQQIGLALKAELEAGGADSRFYAESMATVLSVHLLRRYSSQEQKNKNYTDGLPKYKLKAVVSYIHENLDQNLTLAELAELVQMSPHYFSSLFRQSTGLPPHQYVIKCRIEKAKKLLRQRELPIIEICQEVGFGSQSHFTTVFRQHTQATPKTYRDAL